MKSIFKLTVAAAAVAGAMLLTGCQSSASRMYECEASGVSRDACYVAEQNRKSGINAAATKQAMENANDLYGAKGTETHKAEHKHKGKGFKQRMQEAFENDDDESATDYDGQDVDTDVVYRHGKKGYLNSEGGFVQYAQSAHRKHVTSCDDLKLFLSTGTELTPAQQKELAQCDIHSHHSVGHSHSKTWKGYGVTVRQDADGLVYIDDHAAAIDEQAEKATVYSSGLYQVTIRTNGKADLMKEGRFVGHLK